MFKRSRFHYRGNDYFFFCVANNYFSRKGDNMLTAVSVARDCGMVGSSHKVRHCHPCIQTDTCSAFPPLPWDFRLIVGVRTGRIWLFPVLLCDDCWSRWRNFFLSYSYCCFHDSADSHLGSSQLRFGAHRSNLRREAVWCRVLSRNLRRDGVCLKFNSSLENCFSECPPTCFTSRYLNNAVMFLLSQVRSHDIRCSEYLLLLAVGALR